jgi:hypothetical protein
VLGAALERKPTEEASAHFARSLDQARALGAEYETALTLKAIAETDSSGAADARAASERIVASLGVVSTPSVPRP